jgi:hypothetical protein
MMPFIYKILSTMISTVTTSTITAIAASSFTVGLAAFAALLLIALLITKELVGRSSGVKQQWIARSLNIGIIPLIIVFTGTVCLKVVALLA